MRLVRVSRSISLSLMVAVGLAGCVSTDESDASNTARTDLLNMTAMPPTTTVLTEGLGELSGYAFQNGTAYLYDVDAERILWSGPIDRGQAFTVDPDDNRAMIGDRSVFQGDLADGHRYRLYLDPID